MYFAIKNMRAHGPDGMPLTYLAGDAVPHFMTWPFHVRQSLLNLHYVEMRPETVVVQTVRVDDPSMPLLTPEGQDDTGLACDVCGRTFKDGRGLRLHKAAAHKPEQA